MFVRTKRKNTKGEQTIQLQAVDYRLHLALTFVAVTHCIKVIVYFQKESACFAIALLIKATGFHIGINALRHTVKNIFASHIDRQLVFQEGARYAGLNIVHHVGQLDVVVVPAR